MKRFSFFVLSFVLALAFVRPAAADGGESYAYPSFEELIQTMIMLGGMDIEDKEVVNEYTRLMYCDMYKQNYTDDFSWQNIRGKVHEKLASKNEYYRILYQVVGKIKLEKYDFVRRQFPLSKDTAFEGITYISLMKPGDFKGYCDVVLGSWGGVGANLPRSKFDAFFPRDINVVLRKPFTLMALRLSPENAEAFLEKMERLKITDRSLYIRLRVRIMSASKADPMRRYNFSGSLTDVDLFLDSELTQWFARVSFNEDGEEVGTGAGSH